MLDSVHMVVGAAIGKALRRPYLAVPVAFASHFALDAIPHWSHADLVARPSDQSVLAVVDVAIGTVLVLLLARGRRPQGLIIGCAFAAMAMDVFDYVAGVSLVFNSLPLGPQLTHLHMAMQNHADPGNWLVGLGTQAWTLLIAIGVILWPGRGPRRRKRGPSAVRPSSRGWRVSPRWQAVLRPRGKPGPRTSTRASANREQPRGRG